MSRSLLVAAALASLVPACSSSDDAAPAGSTDDAGADAAADATLDAPVDDAPDGDAGFAPPPPPAGPALSAPFIGSGGFGFNFGSAFAGATAPHGMAKVGADTSGPWGTIGFQHFSGYWYDDDTVLAFSHMHLHGTGATDYGVLGVMPTLAFDAGKTHASDYGSKFTKANEHAEPGFYGTTLDASGIAVEIAATSHAAHHRHTFPAPATTAHLVVDLDHHLEGGSVRDAEVTLVPAEQRVRGRLHSVGGMSGGFGGYDVYFELKTKTPWTTASTWHDAGAPASDLAASGAGVGLVLDFDLAASHTVELQVGLSLVSAAGAAANLAAELPAWDFGATRAATAAEWATLTSLVTPTGGDAVERAMLEASLYHAFVMPSWLGDRDGTFVGLDAQPHQDASFRYVSDLSLWDTYRTLHPLYALVAPDHDRDAVRSLVRMSQDGGFFPKWPIATGEAGTMIGASAEVVLADAWLKGMRDFDLAGAYATMRAAAMDATTPPGGRGGRGDVAPNYLAHGWVDASRGSSVSLTLEYAQNDVALAVLAGATGNTSDQAALVERSHGWRNLFDPKDGFLWGKNADGTWATPRGLPQRQSDFFDEANAWQSLWGAPHDLDGLVAAFGSKDAVIAKLEQFFELGKIDHESLDPNAPLTSNAPRPYYWAANEPDMHAGWMFARLGRPDLTQRWVRWASRALYGAGANGLPGNDDGGTMSAWYVFASMGIYPLVGTDLYIVGAPLFPHLDVKVPGGVFTIDAPAVSTDNLYVQSATLNGAPLTKPELRHADLAAGGSLAFVMGPAPSAWGRD